MTRSSPHRRSSSEDGAAMLEFLFLGVLLLVPLVYVMLTVFAVQRASYAVASASREAGRVYAGAATAAQGRAEADLATGLALDDAGLDEDLVHLSISCDATPCPAPGAAVTVVVTYDVPLPLSPPFLDTALPARVTVTGEHVAVVDPYRSP